VEDRRHNSGRVGRNGEDLSCRYLIGLGHTVIDRNWRAGHLEIDIVSIDGNGIHFVEVKSRTVPFEAPPQESVTRSKQKKLYDAARRYLAGKGSRLSGDMECHFDIISVIFGRDRADIKFFPDAFIPGL
jgi:putative endonuclease